MKTIITFEAENDKEIPTNISIENFESLVKISWQIVLDTLALKDIESTVKVLSAKVEPNCKGLNISNEKKQIEDIFLEGRTWHGYCNQNQIKSHMTKGKVYLYQAYTEIFVEFDTVDQAEAFRAEMKAKDNYWDYDPVSTIDTNDPKECELWEKFF